MKKHDFIISLPGDNRYLREQAAVAKSTADRLGANVHILNAESDSVAQSQQLLELVQAPPERRPSAIVVEPVNETGLPRVAEAAVEAGIGWVISNARVDYLDGLRRTARVPVFAVSQDHNEIGRLQGHQFAMLLPEGGTVLYLRGPASNSLATQRNAGMESSSPSNVRLKTLKIQWTEEVAYQSVSSWLRLSTVHATDIDAIAAQNVDFLMAARRAFQEQGKGEERSEWLNLPTLGVGVHKLTKPLVDQRALTAAVLTATTMDRALELLAQALQTGKQPPEMTFVAAESYPERLLPAARKKPASARGAGNSSLG